MHGSLGSVLCFWLTPLYAGMLCLPSVSVASKCRQAEQRSDLRPFICLQHRLLPQIPGQRGAALFLVGASVPVAPGEAQAWHCALHMSVADSESCWRGLLCPLWTSRMHCC